MSDKPKIYAKCKSGCEWETIHRSEFEELIGKVELQPTSEGYYNLPFENKYEVKVNNDTTCELVVLAGEHVVTSTSVNLYESEGYNRVLPLQSFTIGEISLPDQLSNYLVVFGDLNGTLVRFRIEWKAAWDNWYSNYTYEMRLHNSSEVYSSNIRDIALKSERIFIMYATDANGTNMSDTYSGQSYIGIYTGLEVSNNASDYVWLSFSGGSGSGGGSAEIPEGGVTMSMLALEVQEAIQEGGSDGVGIDHIEYTGTSGQTNTYRIHYTDPTKTPFEFTTTNGNNGVGIANIHHSDRSSDGLTDTYVITLTDNSTKSFNVRHGAAGKAFEYKDFTPEQLEALKGKAFEYKDFTPEQLEALRGPAGTSVNIKGTAKLGTANQNTDGTLLDKDDKVIEGKEGDAWLVDADLYVYVGERTWHYAGNIKGPRGEPGMPGAAGAPGEPGSDGVGITSIESRNTSGRIKIFLLTICKQC